MQNLQGFPVNLKLITCKAGRYTSLLTEKYLILFHTQILQIFFDFSVCTSLKGFSLKVFHKFQKPSVLFSALLYY